MNSAIWEHSIWVEEEIPKIPAIDASCSLSMLDTLAIRLIHLSNPKVNLAISNISLSPPRYFSEFEHIFLLLGTIILFDRGFPL